MQRLPRIVYNAVTLDFSQPPRPWVSGTRGVGAGSETSAAGVPSTWETRRDYPLTVPLRFTTAEWPAVRAWLLWGMRGGAFTFHADRTALGHVCYLDAPGIDDDVQPVPGQYPGDLELTVVLRTAAGVPIDEPYFA